MNAAKIQPELPIIALRSGGLVQLFVDQLDAMEPETAFWKSITHSQSPSSLDSAPHRGEGGATTAVYQNGQLVGISVCMRDDHNRTLLICVDLRLNNPDQPRAESNAKTTG